MKKKIKFELPVNSDDLFEIEIIHTVAEWEKVEAELEALRAKLEKAEMFITIAELSAPLECWDFHHVKAEMHTGSACPIVARYNQALREYRGETK